jgi:hypothetical protein
MGSVLQLHRHTCSRRVSVQAAGYRRRCSRLWCVVLAELVNHWCCMRLVVKDGNVPPTLVTEN